MVEKSLGASGAEIEGSELQKQNRRIGECVQAAAEVWGRSGVQFGALERRVRPGCAGNAIYGLFRIITSSWCLEHRERWGAQGEQGAFYRCS